MRKLPQDMAFPLGLGSKASRDDNKHSKAMVQKSNDSDEKGKENGKDSNWIAPVQDLDTINL